MYLEHFKLNELPFSLTPNTHFYCDLPTHQEALNVLLLGLKRKPGAGLIGFCFLAEVSMEGKSDSSNW